MSSNPDQARNIGVLTLLGTASTLITIFFFQYAASILIPILLGILVTALCSPMFGWLQRKKVSVGWSLTLIALLLIFIVLVVGWIVLVSFINLINTLPTYQQNFDNMQAQFNAFLESVGFEWPELTEVVNYDTLLNFVGSFVSSSIGMVVQAIFVLILTVVMLLETVYLPRKIGASMARPERFLTFMKDVGASITRYMVLRTMLNLVTALAVWVVLALVGVDFSFLWAFLVFLLNYIPYFGTIIAAIPPTVLTLFQLGFWPAVVVLAWYSLVNFIMGNWVEPRTFGHGMGLSILVVFVSLLFWGWVFGFVGAILAIPLTMMIKLFFEATDHYRWVAAVLSDRPPPVSNVQTSEDA